MVKQSLHQRCLPTASSTADDAVLALGNETDNGIPNLLRQTAGLNQFLGRKPAVEFPDSERRAVDGRGRADNGDSGAVRQACIQNGILAGKVLSEDAGDSFDSRL